MTTAEQRTLIFQGVREGKSLDRACIDAGIKSGNGRLRRAGNEIKREYGEEYKEASESNSAKAVVYINSSIRHCTNKADCDLLINNLNLLIAMVKDKKNSL